MGGFAAEIYSARAYRTGDVDVIVEGDVKFVREFLKVVSDVGLTFLSFHSSPKRHRYSWR